MSELCFRGASPGDVLVIGIKHYLVLMKLCIPRGYRYEAICAKCIAYNIEGKLIKPHPPLGVAEEYLSLYWHRYTTKIIKAAKCQSDV